MEYKQLGVTDLQVSRICFGTFAFGGMWGGLDEEAAIATTRKALDLGINFFDTAQAYGFGKAETLIARALGNEIKNRRDSLVLATKGGMAWVEGQLPTRDSSPAGLRKGLEESLAFLGTDYVDLYQVHFPDSGTPFEETASVCEDFVKEGKARYIGVSNYNVDQMKAFAKTRRVDSIQPPYSILAREIEEDILPYCEAEEVGTLVYGPLAHGFIGGKMGPDTVFPDNDWRSMSPAFKGESFQRNLQVVERLKKYAAEKGCSVCQLAIAWALANPAVDVAIVGGRRPEYIEETAASVDVDLTSEEKAEIEELAKDAVPFVEFMPPDRLPS